MRSKKKPVVERVPPNALAVSERTAPAERAMTMSDVQQQVMTLAQFKLLRGETPTYAVKTRIGRGSKNFDYVKHGFVTDQLNKAFGFDWDFQLKPVFNGNIHQLTETEEERYDKNDNLKIVKVRNVAVYGELTVRIRNPQGQVVATITKAGPGSQPWEDKTEFGDAIKGATSDALKVAAMRLGIGLDLYWDDQAEQTEFEDAHKPPPPVVDAQGRTTISIAAALKLAGTLDALLKVVGATALADVSENGLLKAAYYDKLKTVFTDKYF